MQVLWNSWNVKGLKRAWNEIFCKIITLRNKFSTSLRTMWTFSQPNLFSSDLFLSFPFYEMENLRKLYVAHKGLSSIRQIELNFHKIYRNGIEKVEKEAEHFSEAAKWHLLLIPYYWSTLNSNRLFYSRTQSRDGRDEFIECVSSWEIRGKNFVKENSCQEKVT